MNNDRKSIAFDERTAARLVNVSQSYLRQLRMAGKGPAYCRLGRTIRYRIVDVEKWLVGHRVETKG